MTRADAIEVAGVILVVIALALTWLPLAMMAVGVILVFVANVVMSPRAEEEVAPAAEPSPLERVITASHNRNPWDSIR